MSAVNPERFRSKKRPVYSAPISVAASATGTIVAAVPAVAGGPGTGLAGYPAQSIAVVGFYLTGDTAHTTAQFQTSTGPANLTGAMSVPVDGTLYHDFTEDVLFSTLPGDALDLAALVGGVHGWVNYILEPGTSTY